MNQEELLNKIKQALIRYEKQLLEEEKLLDQEILYLMKRTHLKIIKT